MSLTKIRLQTNTIGGLAELLSTLPQEAGLALNADKPGIIEIAHGEEEFEIAVDYNPGYY